MKTLFLSLLVILLNVGVASAQGQQEEVLEVLFERDFDYSIEIKEDTFIPNIQGYACAVPAINVPRHLFYSTALKHNRYGGFMVKEEALIVANFEMRFCSWPSVEQIFGPDYEVGKKVKINLKLKREIVLVTNDWDGKERKVLKETLSTKLFDAELESVGMVSLDPQ